MDGSRLTDLAEQAQVTKQTASLLVAALEREGLVERVPDPADGRARLIQLTSRGQIASGRAREVVMGVEGVWREHLGPELSAALYVALNKLREIADGTSDHSLRSSNGRGPRGCASLEMARARATIRDLHGEKLALLAGRQDRVAAGTERPPRATAQLDHPASSLPAGTPAASTAADRECDAVLVVSAWQREAARARGTFRVDHPNLRCLPLVMAREHHCSIRILQCHPEAYRTGHDQGPSW